MKNAKQKKGGELKIYSNSSNKKKIKKQTNKRKESSSVVWL